MAKFGVSHPSTVYRADVLARARENVSRYKWAQNVVNGLRESVSLTLEKDADFVVQMIPETTPGGTGFTNCPACEGNTIHGAYDWDPANPEQLVCTTCSLVYPNEKYPEDVAFVAEKHGNGQTITYHSGYSFEFHGFHLFSSWTAQIRARKVSFMADQALALAQVYALTDEVAYGKKACEILVRFAEVYPKYLVHSSYGEWIDLPPRLVAEKINALPEDEWTLAPNKPDRKLHSGYWNSGRATGLGMEGSFIRKLVLAYDLVWSLLSDAQRECIEQDLLLESTVMMLADPALNNKSVSNLSAAGLVGMAIGDPDLVRAGAKGFWHFIENWFLFDGTTSESPAYGLMTMNGLWTFGEALHGYSDPADYDGADRIDNLDVYGNGACRAVYRALYETLFPNLRYPAWADSYVPTALGTPYTELMSARYQLPEYRALLGELLGDLPQNVGDDTALFVRDPDFEVQPQDRVTFDDVFFPALMMGFFRMGEDGRGGTVILDASHWGVHHHRDSLNLTLFAHGQEALTDLGYLWDRPDKDMTVRTPAHNLVVVDESEQRTQERLGSLHVLDTHERVKVIDCSSEAYEQCQTYRRMCVWVDHGDAGGYLVDVFKVVGGQTHDALFHGPTPDCDVKGLDLAGSGGGPYGITGVQTGATDAPWQVSWKLEDNVHFTAWVLPCDGEQVMIGKGWGERGWGHFNTPDKKLDVPYVIRRRIGDDLVSEFVNVFEVGQGNALVEDVERLDHGVAVTTSKGVDVIIWGDGTGVEVETALGQVKTDGTLAVVSDTFCYLSGGSSLQVGELETHCDVLPQEGVVKAFENGNDDSFFETDVAVEDVWIGKTVLVDDGKSITGYTVKAIDGLRVYVKKDGQGFDFGGGKKWWFVQSVCELR